MLIRPRDWVLIFFTLNPEEEMTRADLADKFDVDPAAMHDVLRGLVRAGLLARATGRGKAIFYTAGPELLAKRRGLGGKFQLELQVPYGRFVRRETTNSAKRASAILVDMIREGGKRAFVAITVAGIELPPDELVELRRSERTAQFVYFDEGQPVAKVPALFGSETA